MWKTYFLFNVKNWFVTHAVKKFHITRRCNFLITRWISDLIAWHEVQLPFINHLVRILSLRFAGTSVETVYLSSFHTTGTPIPKNTVGCGRGSLYSRFHLNRFILVGRNLSACVFCARQRCTQVHQWLSIVSQRLLLLQLWQPDSDLRNKIRISVKHHVSENCKEWEGLRAFPPLLLLQGSLRRAHNQI